MELALTKFALIIYPVHKYMSEQMWKQDHFKVYRWPVIIIIMIIISISIIITTQLYDNETSPWWLYYIERWTPSSMKGI